MGARANVKHSNIAQLTEQLGLLQSGWIQLDRVPLGKQDTWQP
jgi:hypothetical protein